MLDLHTHILPGLDDGPSHMEEALDMARSFLRAETNLVAATPHFIYGYTQDEREQVLAAVKDFNSLLAAHDLGLKVLPGMEIEICPEIPRLYREGRLLTLNDQGRHLLIELPFNSFPPFTRQVFYELKLLGVTPILAHPERNSEILEDPGIVYDLVTRGVLIQVNGGSLLGYFGKSVERLAVSLLKCRMVHFVAGDAHRAHGTRGPCLHLASPQLEKIIGREAACRLLSENPRAVTEGKNISVSKPIPPKQRFVSRIKKIFCSRD